MESDVQARLRAIQKRLDDLSAALASTQAALGQAVSRIQQLGYQRGGGGGGAAGLEVGWAYCPTGIPAATLVSGTGATGVWTPGGCVNATVVWGPFGNGNVNYNLGAGSQAIENAYPNNYGVGVVSGALVHVYRETPGGSIHVLGEAT